MIKAVEALSLKLFFLKKIERYGKKELSANYSL